MTNLRNWRAVKLDELSKCKDCPKYRECWTGAAFIWNEENGGGFILDEV
jgi:hypothetical protein